MKKLLILLFGLMIAYAGTSFAGKMISVTVKVVMDKNLKQRPNIMGTGFSVNGGKGMGSMGTSTTKMGPAGGTYSFGFKTMGGNVSCGSAKLMQDSAVTLMYNGKSCTPKVTKK